MSVGGWQQSQGSQVSTVQRLTHVLIGKLMSLKPEQGDLTGLGGASLLRITSCMLCPALVSTLVVFPASFFLCNFPALVCSSLMG